MRVEAEHRAAAELGGAFLHGADVEIAEFDRARKIALLERRSHPRALIRRDGTAKHECLGATTDSGQQGAHDDLVGPRRAEPDRANLAETRLSEPERLRDSVFERRTAFVLTGLCHERCCVALRRTSISGFSSIRRPPFAVAGSTRTAGSKSPRRRRRLTSCA